MLKSLPVVNLLQRSLNVHEKFNFFLHGFKLVGVNKNCDTFTMLGDDERPFSILNLLNKICDPRSNFGQWPNVFVDS